MKKRRVLALLLALSLAVSTNGMTVLATEAGEPAAPAVSAVEESTDDVQDRTDTADDENAVDDAEDIDLEETEKDGEVGEGSMTDETGTDEEGTTGKEDSDEKDETNPDDQNPDAADAVDETLSGNDLTDEEESAAKESEELPKAVKSEVRMMTFTDDTGMKITYDANAAANYKYTVENGVLVKVEEANGEDESGNQIWKQVEFTGNVELTQPEEEKYTSVAADLFGGNTKVTYVKLPDGVTSIAYNTFNGCTALKGVYLPATVTSIETSAFEGCVAMTQIAVPKAVTSIGDNAFKGDAKLYMVYMKDVDYSALSSIGDSAFEGCPALAEFCSDTEFFIPASLKSIGESAFKKCAKIKKVDLDTAQLKTIGASAFEDCTGMTDAVMCRTLAEIPTSAFEGCTGLASLVFSSKESLIVGERAFYGCYSLRQIVLPETVTKVSDNAFAGCLNLNRVVVESALTEIEGEPFPAGKTNSTLYFVGKQYINSTGKETSKIYDYFRQLKKEKVDFIRTDVNNSDFFKYKVADNSGVVHADGKITGGQIWVGTAEENHADKNINTLHDGKGVVSDGTKYYVYHQAVKGYSLVEGSIRSNGEIVQKDKTGYYIMMPLGGTVITAEFRLNGTSNIVGQEANDVTVEFSNGEPILPGGVEYGVELKVGQTTRMFLIDKSGVPISSSQIKKIVSGNTAAAKVSNTGLITAVGKGTARIRVDLTGGAGNSFSIERTIRVVEADIDSISLVASNYDSIIKITGDAHGIQTAAVSKTVVGNESLSITLKANVYTEAKEGLAKELTWKSSDTRIATVKKAQTTTADSRNVIAIKKGSEGEATITVTAKINSKKTVSQKFVVSVQDKTVKLASSSVTVNPNLEVCGEIELVSSYGEPLPEQVPKIYKKSDNGYLQTDFLLERKVLQNENSKSCRYNIGLYDEKIEDGSYKVYVCLDESQKEKALPLTITVKRPEPSPTVKFNTKKTKFNIFYKNGGTDKNGNPIVVTTEVTKLGKAKLRKAELCALSVNKPDDQLFVENFEIVDSKEDLAKGIIKIKKRDEYLKYSTGKDPKPVVTGYLKLYYEGYKDTVSKKIKVTMPTVTTAPTYVLDRTSTTYKTGASKQHETLKLLDKKTKKQILNENIELLRVESNASIVDTDSAKVENSEISFDVYNPQKDKVKIVLKNPSEWEQNTSGGNKTLSYTFSVKVTDSEPIIKTDRTVTLNLNYPEVEGSFGLKSNQADTELAESQEFKPNKTTKNALEYEKLEVSYKNGIGTVKIKSSAEKPATGTYKWTCNAEEKDGYAPLSKATTLTVKVVNTKPVVKLGKGSLVLNLATGTRTDEGEMIYGEKAEIPVKFTGKPEGYELNTDVNAGADNTQIVCTTKNEDGAENKFDWTLYDAEVNEAGKLVDGKLVVSIKDMPLTKKTYTFKMTARYVQQVEGDDTPNIVDAKPMTFKVKVDNNSNISVSFSAKGKLNLVDREGAATTKNTIIYTPSLKNVRGKIVDAWIYDASNNKESRFFDIALNPENGKLYVTPKKTLIKNENGGTGDNNENGGNTETGDNNGSVSGNTTGGESGTGGNTGTDETKEPENHETDSQSEMMQEYQYAEVQNNKQYRVKIEVKVEGYDHSDLYHNGIMSQPITIKTAQVLPTVTTDKSTLNVYLSNKEYDATFTVTPKAGAPGIVEGIKFHDNDEVSKDAFEIKQEMQSDGSLKVTIHLNEAVAYKCNSTHAVKMYIKFKGQGTNTKDTLITMNIRVNK